MRWPECAAVREAVADWTLELAARRADVRAVGYFGSLARGTDWGVGSDADLVVILDATEESFERRGSAFDTTSLPVPADVLVYSREEGEGPHAGNAFHDRVVDEVVWVHRRDEVPYAG
jgi:predicted nucleotidyltransferase